MLSPSLKWTKENLLILKAVKIIIKRKFTYYNIVYGDKLSFLYIVFNLFQIYQHNVAG